MNEKKILSILFLIVNILAFIFLGIISYPYLIHDTTVANPDAMLPMKNWDRAGMLMTFGFFPITSIGLLSFSFSGELVEKIYIRILNFLPALTCLVMVLTYWI